MHGFLKEIGQGIQHIASRVDDLPAFVQRANDFRKITGEVSLLSSIQIYCSSFSLTLI